MEEKGKMLKINYEEKNGNEKERKTEADRETDKSESHKEVEMEKVFDGWTQQQKERGRRGGREGGRSSSVHAPLPMQRGLLPGGTQTLSPCPALYSPGYCSQINLASYPM